MIILDGKATASFIKDKISKEVEILKNNNHKAPHLAAVLVGNDPASETYVNAKVTACKKVGFESTLFRFDTQITEDELLHQIEKLNNNNEIDGYIVQLPLPNHINEKKVTQAISPYKDVDGFHPINLGRMMLGLPGFLPATPYGILMMLKHYQIATEGKHCVVIGRSNIVGTPMSLLLSRNKEMGNATVSIVHSKSKNIESITRLADIIIVAVGKKGFLKANMVKKGVIVIDVGIHRVEDSTKNTGFSLCGDVDFDEVAPLCAAISPVPGGVGPMTIVGLLKNTLNATKFNLRQENGLK
jgi:methylenetetrahydrofolate dehydrogenase (NADP+) / methenyltetrahydrofolate cyclohydrolase